MKDRRCVHKHNVMLIGNSTRLDQLIRIKGDRLFAKHVLSSRQSSMQVLDMGIMGRGDVDGVNRWICI